MAVSTQPRHTEGTVPLHRRAVDTKVSRRDGTHQRFDASFVPDKLGERNRPVGLYRPQRVNQLVERVAARGVRVHVPAVVAACDQLVHGVPMEHHGDNVIQGVVGACAERTAARSTQMHTASVSNRPSVQSRWRHHVHGQQAERAQAGRPDAAKAVCGWIRSEHSTPVPALPSPQDSPLYTVLRVARPRKERECVRAYSVARISMAAQVKQWSYGNGSPLGLRKKVPSLLDENSMRRAPASSLDMARGHSQSRSY